MPLSELKALLDSERNDALAATRASKLSVERSDAMDYYLGDMAKDMPAPEGRSRAVSTDVADTIEGLMPSLMEIFCGGDEVVRFEPVGPNDSAAAEQETDYVNHVFMQVNPGFLILYSFIKDALVSKTGIVKVWWEDRTVAERETYYDLTDDAFALLTADPDVEIAAHSARPALPPQEEDRASAFVSSPLPEGERVASEASRVRGARSFNSGTESPSPRPSPLRGEGAQEPQMPEDPPDLSAEALAKAEGGPLLHDVECIRSRNAAQAKIEPVPPEEFGISRNARSLRDCDYCFHKVLIGEARLIAQGFDRAQVRTLPSYTAISNTEELDRNTVDESQYTGDQANQAARRIEVTEHYVRMDYEGDGTACLYKVTTGGSQGDILTKDGKPDIEPVDVMPFAAMTPVIVTHRFFGRSIADLVMDIQRIKTALLRAMLDNAYLANNPRVEVAEAFAGPDTLDDLLVSRPGGIVRTKQPGGLAWQVVPSVAAQTFPVLEYMDAARELRTGVTRQGQGIDADALQNQSATAVNTVFTAAQARIKLIARIFAETGIRDLFALLHQVIRKHGESGHTVQLRKQWVTVNPREWKTRNEMTVHVGLGTGTRQQQLGMMNMIIAAQEKAIGAGLVSRRNLHNSAIHLARLAGFKNADEFFTDPGAPGNPQDPAAAPIAPPPHPDAMKAQAAQHEAQGQIQLAAAKAQADAQHEAVKTQAGLALEQQRFEHQKQLAVLEHGLKLETHQMEMRKAHADLVKTAASLAGSPGADGKPQPVDLDGLIGKLATLNHPLPPPPAPPHKGMRIVRDAAGRVSHAVPIE
jgi:hypothetical protein